MSGDTQQDNALLEFLKQQQKQHEDQQALLMGMLEPKPLLQKFTPDDDIEHFLVVFERIARQQKWAEEMWATQLAGLLTGKAMAAYAALSSEDANDYSKVKEAILRQYDVNEESRRRKFRKDRK